MGRFERFFLLYAQKLSGHAKTFRVPMLPCYPGFCASGREYFGLAETKETTISKLVRRENVHAAFPKGQDQALNPLLVQLYLQIDVDFE